MEARTLHPSDSFYASVFSSYVPGTMLCMCYLFNVHNCTVRWRYVNISTVQMNKQAQKIKADRSKTMHIANAEKFLWKVINEIRRSLTTFWKSLLLLLFPVCWGLLFPLTTEEHFSTTLQLGTQLQGSLVKSKEQSAINLSLCTTNSRNSSEIAVLFKPYFLCGA